MVVSTERISHIVVKQTNSNWGTFSMFHIIENPWNYFARELLHDNLSSKFCSEEVFCRPSIAPVVWLVYCLHTSLLLALCSNGTVLSL